MRKKRKYGLLVFFVSADMVMSLYIRPLLDDGLKGGNSECPERASLFFAFLSVCLSVCYQATGHSFQPSNLIFWKYVLYDYGKTVFFRFSKF